MSSYLPLSPCFIYCPTNPQEVKNCYRTPTPNPTPQLNLIWSQSQSQSQSQITAVTP